MSSEFIYHPEQQAWISTSMVPIFGSDLQIFLADETGSTLESQQKILEHALEVIPQIDVECRKRLFQFYQDACEDFSDLVGTELLPVIDEDQLDTVFGFSTLEVPEQIEKRGMTFKLLGGCSWNEEDGVQLFFRNSTLEHVDSGAALHW